MRFKIFGNYFLVIDMSTHLVTVVSVKRGQETILKPTVRSKMSYYRLYQSGIPQEYSLEKLVSTIETNTPFTGRSHTIQKSPMN